MYIVYEGTPLMGTMRGRLPRSLAQNLIHLILGFSLLSYFPIGCSAAGPGFDLLLLVRYEH